MGFAALARVTGVGCTCLFSNALSRVLPVRSPVSCTERRAKAQHVKQHTKTAQSAALPSCVNVKHHAEMLQKAAVCQVFKIPAQPLRGFHDQWGRCATTTQQTENRTCLAHHLQSSTSFATGQESVNNKIYRIIHYALQFPLPNK